MRAAHLSLGGIVIPLLCVLWLGGGCQSDPGENRSDMDLAIINANVWTGARDAGEAQAIGVSGDRILVVGTNEDVKKLVSPRTRVIDARGRRVIPGMTDTHVHTVWSGRLLSQLDVRDVPDRQAFIDAVAQRARELPEGEWLLGGNWNVESWPDESPPRKEWIDPVTGDRPVWLRRTDGHMGLANSAALKLAGIDRNGPPDPEGGEIERDPQTNEPTGLLKDAAMGLVSSQIPAPSEEEMYRSLLDAMRELNRWGIVAAHDLTEPAHLPVFQRAHRDGAMTIRVTGYLSVADWDEHHSTVRDYPIRDEWIQMNGFKGFMDGSLGSRTAYMREPFTDATAQSKYPRGMLMEMVQPPERFREMMRRADAAGFQLAIHAIGDEANHILLNHYEAVLSQPAPANVASAQPARGSTTAPTPTDAEPPRFAPRRHRIEHSQHLLKEDIPRFGTLGVVPVMQPRHKHDDGRFAEDAIGAERGRLTYAWRLLFETGAMVCFGSDWPVATPNPFAGIAAAVTGLTADGETWVPEQNISVEQALRAYTTNGAWTEGREAERGTIETGKLADVVILSQDILTCPPERIIDTTATHTIVGGRVVHQQEQ